ncbi:hypothetical protein BC833DRAFT_610367 [Globomyces pollinis-pini]|nr:hypothetical protein BC833DRAFT_610367 [Globomyces pollinis-pini]
MHITLALLGFTKLALGFKIVESQWKSSDICSGPPNSMVVFSLVDLETTTPSDEEKWSITFTYSQQEYPMAYGYCGNLNFPTTSQCCFSSLDLDATGDYKSSLPYLFEEDIVLDLAIPKSANGFKYCQLQFENSNSSIPSFEQHMMLADGSCVDGIYRCLPDGSLKLYNDPKCNLEIESFKLTESPSDYQSQTVDTFIGQISAFSQSKNSVLWVGYVPSNYLVPNTSSFWDIFTGFSNAFAILFILMLLLYSLYSFRKLRSQFWGSNILLQLVRIVFMIINIQYYYIPTDYKSMVYMGEIRYALIGLEGVGTAILTLSQIFGINFNLINKMKPYRYVFYFLTIALNFGLMSGLYLYVCILGDSWCPSIDLIFNWMSYAYLWNVYIFLLEIIPVTLMVLILTSQSLTRLNLSQKALLEIFHIDSRFTILYILEIFLFIAYFVATYILNDTAWLGSDRAFISFHMFRNLISLIYKIVSVGLLARVPLIFEYVVNKRKKSDKEARATNISGTQSTK